MSEGAYSSAVLDHFRHPRNPGRIADGPGVAMGEAGDEAGEKVRLWLRVEDGVLRELRFKAFGCPGTIACASFATERLLGRTLAQARTLSADELAEGLDLARERLRLAALPIAALACAIERLAEAGR